MTNEEAIKLLSNVNAQSPLAEALKMAVKSLEKQIPKKPYWEGDGYDEDGEIVYDIWRCPNCDEMYEYDYDIYDCCPNCGQAIDWGRR